MGRITAGSGYDYLTNAVAKDRHDYYSGAGEAAGVWSGSGRHELGLDGEVDADDMAALYGRFVDPRTAGNKRVDERGRPIGEVAVGEGLRESKRINQGTGNEKVLHQVAAFDVTFSPAKSVSVLWGLSTDQASRATVVEAHEKAVDVGLAYLEANAGHARAGRNGVRRVDTAGFIIARFRHRTARTTDPTQVGDPQLHTHCAILNRLKCADGKWRTVDGAAIYVHAHAAGAVYAATLEQELSRTLGVSWATPDGRVMMREIDGVPEAVVSHFSSRRAQVLEHYDRMEAEWRTIHGRTPTRNERSTMLGESTVRSRQGKVAGDGSDLHQRWQAQLTPTESAAIDNAVRHDTLSNGGRLGAGSRELTDAVFNALHEQRAWWTRAHLSAEVARLIDTPTLEAIELEVERIVLECVNLEPDADHTYAQPDRTKFSSHTILAAEQRVITAANAAAPWTVATVFEASLGDDQVAAVDKICAGEHALTTVIGPAGAGKTTMLKAAAAGFAAAGRPVTVLTLSANASKVVTAETGLPASTIADWKVGNNKLPRGGLLVVDEASMVPTLTLDQLVRVASAYGCRIALVGDYAQMGAPEAGGLLRDLAAQDSAVTMTAVWRFKAEWERAASKQLRQHNTDVADTYDEHGRINPVTEATAVDQIMAAWHYDITSGLDSIIVVDTEAQAHDVAARCQQQRLVDGHLGDTVGVPGMDGNRARIDDLIQSRQNTSALATSDGHRVLNRDVWRVIAGTADGGFDAVHVVTAIHARFVPGYITDHVQLAYAATIAGAQGRTTDTGHVLVTPRTTSSALYVGLTRGRHTNIAHVITDGHLHEELGIGTLTSRDAFAAAVQRAADGERSATSQSRAWTASASTRAEDRSSDRLHQAVTAWWIHRAGQIRHGRAPAALQGHHHQVIAILETCQPDIWDHLVALAVPATDWPATDAGATFVARLTKFAGSRRTKFYKPNHTREAGLSHLARPAPTTPQYGPDAGRAR